MNRKPLTLLLLIFSLLTLGWLFNQSHARAEQASSAAVAATVGSAFNYQGRLNDGGVPANGSYDFEFSLYDDATAGSQIGSTLAQTLVVNNGLFNTSLDFGFAAINGDERYLEVAVQLSGGGGLTTLTSRQALTAVPHATFAEKTRPIQNVINVAKSGGDYTTITAALNTISGASFTNGYLIRVGPGVYNETVILKDYVDIEGSGQDITIIEGIGGTNPDSGATVRALGTQAVELRYLTILSNGLGKSFAVGVYASAALNSFRLTHVSIRVQNAHTNQAFRNEASNIVIEHVSAYANGGNYTDTIANFTGSAPTLNDVTAGASGAVTQNVAIFNYDSASPKLNQVTAYADSGTDSYGVLNQNNSTAVIRDAHLGGGTHSIGYDGGSSATVFNTALDGTVPAGTGLICLDSFNLSGQALDTACLPITLGDAVTWDNVANVPSDVADGDDVADADADPTNELQDLSLSGTILSLSGDATSVDLSGVATPANIIWVAKSGGDFTTVTAALASITDATSSNPYLIRIAPGIYQESVTLKDAVDIEGSGEGVTILRSLGGGSISSAAVLTITSAMNSEVRFLTLESKGTGQSHANGVYADGATGFFTLTHVAIIASGAASWNVGIYNLDSLTRLNDVTITATDGTDSYGIINDNSSPTIIDTEINAYFGSLLNVSLWNNNTSSATLHDSRLYGNSYSIVLDSGTTVSIANTMLDGAVSGTNFTCVGAYSGTFISLGANCQ